MWTMWITLELMREALWTITWWGVVYPVAKCAATPLILLAALFLRKPYWRTVAEMFAAVTAFCTWTYWLFA